MPTSPPDEPDDLKARVEELEQEVARLSVDAQIAKMEKHANAPLRRRPIVIGDQSDLVSRSLNPKPDEQLDSPKGPHI